jgi:hypothetical protein
MTLKQILGVAQDDMKQILRFAQDDMRCPVARRTRGVILRSAATKDPHLHLKSPSISDLVPRP